MVPLGGLHDGLVGSLNTLLQCGSKVGGGSLGLILQCLEKPRNRRLVITPELPRAPRSMAEAAVLLASATVQLSGMASSSARAAPMVMLHVRAGVAVGHRENVQLIHAGALVGNVVGRKEWRRAGSGQ